MKFNDVKLVSNDQYLFGIDDNHIYMSCVTGNPGDSRDSTEWTGQNNYMYSYNTKTKELNLLKNRDCYAVINVKSIHDSDKYFSIDIITDDYCDINLTPGEDDDMQRIKYYYKTGKIEKLN